MGCRKCGRDWLRVEGNKLICVCGYTETVEGPTREELLKRIAELEKRIEELTQELSREALRSKSEGVKD